MMVETAILAAREAGSFLKGHFGKKMSVTQKSKVDFVTNIDVDTERLIIDIIRAQYPEHNIIGEELGEQKGNSQFTWLLDPIDATINYMHNIPFFSVALALLKNDKPVLGVIYDPCTDELFVAQKGKGATLNGEKIQVSDVKKIEQAYIVLTWGSSKENKKNAFKLLEQISYNALRVRVEGCSSLNLCWLATGRIDAYIHNAIKSFLDITPGLFIFMESGGVSSDFCGTPYTSEAKTLVCASSQLLHKDLMEQINLVG